VASPETSGYTFVVIFSFKNNIRKASFIWHKKGEKR